LTAAKPPPPVWLEVTAVGVTNRAPGVPGGLLSGNRANKRQTLRQGHSDSEVVALAQEGEDPTHQALGVHEAHFSAIG
jgi:hypothetical protein